MAIKILSIDTNDIKWLYEVICLNKNSLSIKDNKIYFYFKHLVCGTIYFICSENISETGHICIPFINRVNRFIVHKDIVLSLIIPSKIYFWTKFPKSKIPEYKKTIKVNPALDLGY